MSAVRLQLVNSNRSVNRRRSARLEKSAVTSRISAWPGSSGSGTGTTSKPIARRASTVAAAVREPLLRFPIRSMSASVVVNSARLTETPVSPSRRAKLPLVMRGPGAWKVVPPGMCRRTISEASICSGVIGNLRMLGGNPPSVAADVARAVGSRRGKLRIRRIVDRAGEVDAVFARTACKSFSERPELVAVRRAWKSPAAMEVHRQYSGVGNNHEVGK